ncbi:hypothetical protein HDA32_000587 [Spinactinospora alkalitolerans]|uniref:Uncharacterized protein n=1 Tax=Spinactinospora alkalitolerans TaxID=687207 RepID=A0A852TQA7_9ACTN|nr:hypothetical protein [Spinactinospora alkalitolerans]NYE45467.1 hypothetical protein [Spinactinospora alkalitolerans]
MNDLFGRNRLGQAVVVTTFALVVAGFLLDPPVAWGLWAAGWLLQGAHAWQTRSDVDGCTAG